MPSHPVSLRRSGRKTNLRKSGTTSITRPTIISSLIEIVREHTELLNDNLQSVTQDFIDNLENNEVVEETKIEPSFDKPVIKKETFNSIPQITSENRIDYKITDNNLGVGTPKERFTNNIEAIKVLKNCEDDNRLATKEEQEILAKYVGWGGLSKAFDSNDSSWSNEYNTLKDLLTEEEYKNARKISDSGILLFIYTL